MQRKAMSRKPKARKSPALRALRQGKRLGRSAVSKGPARDLEHLARVRGIGCLCFNKACSKGIEAHHVRCIGPRTMGKRVSDYLTVPLCPWHHRLLHSMNERLFWIASDAYPAEWIRNFSPEGAAELERIEQKTASNKSTEAKQ